MSKTQTKTQTRTIFSFFLFTIFFALLSACGGGGSDKNGSDPGSSNPDNPVEEPVEEPVPPAPFSSTWRVSADGETITLPLVDDAMYTYNFTVDWGDGSPISEITSFDDADKTHTYETAGDYNLVIEGTLEAWSFNNADDGDKDKILSVEDFGDLGYTNLSGAFHGCTNLEDFEGGVTSAVTDMSSMFEGATDTNPDVSNWDVSSVTGTGMTNMFNGAAAADPDVSNWDVSKVTDMSFMFWGATNADPDMSEWDVSSVINMESMFRDTTSADPNVSNWDVSKVTDMSSMFEGATSANPDVSNWDVSKVTDMTNMFNGATAADPDVSGWVVSEVTGMTNMFDDSGLSTANYNAFLINLADNNASVQNVALGVGTLKYDSFAARTALDALVDDRGWTITDGGAADSIASFRSTWKTSADGETITLPLVSGYTYDFTVDWGDGNSSEITSFGDGDKTHIYATAGDDHNIVIKGTLEAWSFNDTGDKDKILSVESFGDLGYKNLSGAFQGCTNLAAFEGGITSDVTDMRSMFHDATNATPSLSNWNVSKVTHMTDMFLDATSANPNVSGWNVSKVTDMNTLFAGATSADPNVSSWDVSKVTKMNGMFYTATNANPDMSSWNVSAVTDMGFMFDDSALSTANYDALLINLANNTSVTGVALGASGIMYSSDDAETARNTLKNDRGWTITDGGDATPP